MITDHNIAWIRERQRYTVFDLNCLSFKALNAAGAAVFDTGALLFQDIHYLYNIGLSSFIALYMRYDTVLVGYIRCPYNLNPDFPIGCRLNFAHFTAFSGTFNVNVYVKPVLKNAVLLTNVATGSPNFILERAVDDTLWKNLWTNRKTSMIGLIKKQIEDGALLQFGIYGSVSDSHGVALFGLELDYVPQRCSGSGKDYDCPLVAAL